MRGEDVSLRDVKIKIPDGYWNQGMWVTSCTGSVGRGFGGFEKKQLVEFLPPNERVKIQTWARPDNFVRYGRRALVGLRAESASKDCVSLSSGRKTFNSKVIKSFVPELRIRKVFRVYFGLPMSISHIRILWIYYTMSNFSGARFRLFVAWNIHTVVFLLIFVFWLFFFWWSFCCLYCFRML